MLLSPLLDSCCRGVDRRSIETSKIYFMVFFNQVQYYDTNTNYSLNQINCNSYDFFSPYSLLAYYHRIIEEFVTFCYHGNC